MFLCIDTISSTAGITLASSDSATHLPLDPQNSSEGIIDTIDKALKKASTTLADLQGIFVINGPGSFTGLRVGLSVANQFAHQLKLPIVALRTDQWWLLRTDEPTSTYLQSMNRAEVYVSQGEKGIIKEIETLAPCTWLGELSPTHRDQLNSEFRELPDLFPIEKTWQKAVQKHANPAAAHRTYDLVEPFYGKEPNITKSKKEGARGIFK